MSEQNEQISAADEISEDQDTSQGASQALMAQGHESQAAAVTSPRPPTSPKTHHLLKHQLPEKDVSQHFGTSDQKAIGKIITKMGQRELQASSVHWCHCHWWLHHVALISRRDTHTTRESTLYSYNQRVRKVGSRK